jgi:hypothetical protein
MTNALAIIDGDRDARRNHEDTQIHEEQKTFVLFAVFVSSWFRLAAINHRHRQSAISH